MRLLDRVLLLIVIVCFMTATSSSTTSRKLKLLVLRLSPEKSAKSLDDLPDRWRTMENDQHRPPQMEIHLLKDRASPGENWLYTNEYKYFGSNNEYVWVSTLNTRDWRRVDCQGNLPWPFCHESTSVKTKSSAIDERKVSARLGIDRKLRRNSWKDEDEDDGSDNIVMPVDRIIPEINTRNIIHAPIICEDGEHLDQNGCCRKIFPGCKLLSFTFTVNITEIIVTFAENVFLLFWQNSSGTCGDICIRENSHLLAESQKTIRTRTAGQMAVDIFCCSTDTSSDWFLLSCCGANSPTER